MPGVTTGGEFAIVATSEALAFVSGRVSGPAAVVVSDSLPFMVTTAGANERFVLPVRASQTFTLRVLGPDGALRGTATGVAPASGRVDIGDPVGASTGRLTLTVEPGAGSIVDLTAPVIFQFSEPLESRSVAPAIVSLDGGAAIQYSAPSPSILPD